MALTKTQYNEIQRIYDGRQASETRRMMERRAELRKKLPSLCVLQDKRGQLALHAAEKLLQGDRREKERLQEELSGIDREIRDLLQKNSYPADYLERHYVCRDCLDTGRIGERRCHCFLEEKRKILYRQSRVEEILRRENFLSFRPELFDNVHPLPGVIDENGRAMTQRAQILSFRADLLVYTRSFGEDSPSLIFMGKPGTGKTFMMNCVAKELLDQGRSVIYYSAEQLMEALSFQKRRGEEEEDAREDIMEVDMLCIDDLGTEYRNNYTLTTMFQILNERMLLRKPVMISTNMNFEQIREEYSERIASRLLHSSLIFGFQGNDLRL